MTAEAHSDWLPRIWRHSFAGDRGRIVLDVCSDGVVVVRTFSDGVRLAKIVPTYSAETVPGGYRNSDEMAAIADACFASPRPGWEMREVTSL